MKTGNKAIGGVLAVLILAGITMGQAQTSGAGTSPLTFYVNDPVGRNTVTFKSSAPLEDIVGTSSEISGFLKFDPRNPEQGGKAELRVPVKSLDTGIPTRNEHLVSAGWMDAEQFPDIILTVEKLTNIIKTKETESSITFDLTAHGNINIHGVSKGLEIPARVTYLAENEATQKRLAGDILAVRAGFQVALADFGITGPKEMSIIGSKVGETIAIEVSVMGSTKSEAPAGSK